MFLPSILPQSGISLLLPCIPLNIHQTEKLFQTQDMNNTIALVSFMMRRKIQKVLVGKLERKTPLKNWVYLYGIL
jgi:hypothetical protein